jgi:hypothetical protein
VSVRRRNIDTLLMIAASLLMHTGVSFAQDVSAVAIEGHVFDAKTLRPLENATVIYAFTTVGGLGGDFTAITNSSGFYQIEFPPANQPLATAGITAICSTRRGAASASGTVYTSLRTEVYRRDLYVTLPRRMSKCTP